MKSEAIAQKKRQISPMKASKNIQIYKITKIVRALWLAERSVCMRVCKHGCGVKLFGFSRANHASTNLKKFSSSKLDNFTLFTHSFVRWNMENRYEEGESIFLRFNRTRTAFHNIIFHSTHTNSFLHQAMGKISGADKDRLHHHHSWLPFRNLLANYCGWNSYYIFSNLAPSTQLIPYREKSN